jgi:phosphoglycerate dehydrogenase-like enzyme
MAETTVVVLGDPGAALTERIKAGLGPDVRIKYGRNAEALQPELPDAKVLFNWVGGKEDAHKVMQAAPGLEWIHARYAGLDRLLFPELAESPIVVTNGRGVFSQSLGEFALLGALYFAKHVPRMLKSKADKFWDRFDVLEIAHQKMGIVGHGDIGRACAWRAKAMGMKVVALRRDISPREGDEHVDRVYPTSAILEMLPECDYVVVAAPLTADTHHMMGAKEFAAMRPHAVIMNVGRGPVIDEAAMIEALKSGAIRGAALDVFEEEPLPKGSPLWDMDNVLISPHCADNTKDWLQDAADFFVAQFGRWKAGEALKNVVDKKAGY